MYHPTMISSVINLVNHIGLDEGKTSLIECYDHKGNPGGNGDINIAVVDEAHYIIGADKDTDEQD